MSAMYDHIPGRWSAIPPRQAGVYLVRVPGSRPWVAYCDQDSLEPAEPNATKATREYFYLEGDIDGQRTRWDDVRVAQTAKANGWREQRHSWT